MGNVTGEREQSNRREGAMCGESTGLGEPAIVVVLRPWEAINEELGNAFVSTRLHLVQNQRDGDFDRDNLACNDHEYMIVRSTRKLANKSTQGG